MTFSVVIEDHYHYQDEEHRSNRGAFATYEEALERCHHVVRRSLDEVYEPGMNSEALMTQYMMFGEDPWITPTPDGTEPFSARLYAQQVAKKLCRSDDE